MIHVSVLNRDRQTGRQTDRQVDRQVDRQIDRPTDRSTDRKTYRQPLFQALLMVFPHFDAIHTTLKKFETMKFKVAFSVSSVIQCKSYMV